MLVATLRVWAIAEVLFQITTFEGSLFLEPSLDQSLEPSVDQSLGPLLEPSLDQSLEPSLEPSLGQSLEPSLDQSLRRLLEPSMYVPPLEPRNDALATGQDTPIGLTLWVD